MPSSLQLVLLLLLPNSCLYHICRFLADLLLHHMTDCPDFFKPGDCVEAFGLSSEAGKLLNGKKGVVFRHSKSTDRVEVHFEGEEKARSLDSERLRKTDRSKEAAKDGLPAKARAGAAPAVVEVIDEPAAPAAPAAQAAAQVNPQVHHSRSIDDLTVGDLIEVFGLKGFQAQYNGQTGTILQIGALGRIQRGAFMIKFSELVIDSNGELAEKGQAVTLSRANVRVPGTGPPGEKHESFAAPTTNTGGFSKPKKSRSSSSSRSRSRSRRKKSSKKKNRR